MKGLRDLRIELVVSGPAWQNLQEAEAFAILEPLQAIMTPKDFELIFPYPIGSSETPFRALPCQVRRTNGTKPI